MNAVTDTNANTAVAAPGGYDPYAAYGQEAASGGTFLKFAKVEWQKGQNSEEVPLGTKLAANMAELSIGWIRWADGKPAERRFGLLASGHRPESRDQLGYDAQDEWETDKEGKPVDPWSFTNELPVADPETGELLTLSASSKGGIGCIGNLCKAYGRDYKAKGDLVPLLELGRDSYIHSEYGKLYVPVLTIVDWIANDGIAKPAASAAASNDDDDTEAAVSNVEKQAAEPPAPKAGGKTRF